MSEDWKRTSWGSEKRWKEDALEHDCPLFDERGEEMPLSSGRLIKIAYYCQRKCGLYAEPSPPWVCCPRGKQIVETVREFELA